jgi:hypothetical protein
VPQIWEQSAAVLVTAANPEHGPLAASLLKQQGKNLFIWGMASPACRAFLRLLSAHLDPEQNGWGAAYYSAGLPLVWAASVVILPGYGVMPSADVYRLISASRDYGPYSRAKFKKNRLQTGSGKTASWSSQRNGAPPQCAAMRNCLICRDRQAFASDA